MDNKINDVFDDLEENINISDIYNLEKIRVKNKYSKGINDITNDTSDLELKGKENIGIYINKTKNFDSFLKDKKIKEIDISNKPVFFEKILLGLKGKITLSGNMIGTFNDRIYFSKSFFKKLGSIIILLIILLGINSFIVEYKTKSGYNKILSIKEDSGNITYIQNTVNKARFDFIMANILFKPFLLIPNNNIRNGYYILQGGKDLTTFLDIGIQSYISTDKFIKQSGGLEKIQVTNLLVNIKPDISKLSSLLYKIVLSYNNVGNLGNKDLNNKLTIAKQKLGEGYKLLNILDRDFNVLLSLLGHEKQKKYLVLFQNNDEIRATGGFIGSLATVTIKKGQVIDFTKEDVYAYEWQINKVYKTKSVAPEGLNKITDTFGLRDSNYFIDFESSSKSINFFLKKINKNVDGIIYINQKTFLDFLELTGPIQFDQIGDTITKENFSFMISTLVEAQSFKIGTLGTPKKILFDFANVFISKIKTDKNYFAYLDLIMKNIKSRDIVLYSFNSEENNLLWKLGLNGKINYRDSLDFNYPVYTSIGGNKSDRYIKLKYKKNITTNYDCSIDTNLEIFRTHTFSKFEEKKVNDLLDKYPIKDKTREDILNIQGKGVNKSYIRVVLPKNIKVKPQIGMSINKYEKSTVVDFYMNTRVLESTKFNIEYTITNKDCKKYSYKYYKQPGIKNYNLEINKENKIIKEYGIKKDYLFYENK